MTPEERAARNAATAAAVERLFVLHAKSPLRPSVHILDIDPDIAYSFYASSLDP